MRAGPVGVDRYDAPMQMGVPVARDGAIWLDADTASGPRHAWFRVPEGTEASLDPEVSLIAGLLPALRLGEDLHLDAPVSPRLLAATSTIQDIFVTWDRTIHLDHRRFRHVDVTAPATRPAPVPPSAPAGRGTACFFTGGVDSFHSVCRHRDSLNALVYVHGFDVPLDDAARRQVVSSRLRAAADHLGLPLLEVESDLEAFGSGAGVTWAEYHGAALAAVAMLLAPRFDRFLVPATHTYGHLEGLGSHPLLDPLWSTEAVEIVHDGADATRVDKLAVLADEPAAREHLRVCWRNADGRYNCGRCEKCVRTAVAARIAGVEGRFPTLGHPSLVEVAQVRATGRGSSWHDLHDELVRTGANPRLRRAIQAVLARHQLARWSLTKRWFG